MKFPIKHCVPISMLTKDTYSDLICRMVSDGYVNMIPHVSYVLASCWNYIGVSMYGDINVYNHPYSFMEVNEWGDYQSIRDEGYPNILKEKFIEEYLK